MLTDSQNNGGSVTTLEKQADYLISDHARKDSPAGSYSWKWIEDSLKNGQLLNRDEYAIKLPGSESRPRGAVPQKRTRTAYTKEDDRILAKFVTRKEKQNVPTHGNVIFQELEAKVFIFTNNGCNDSVLTLAVSTPHSSVMERPLG